MNTLNARKRTCKLTTLPTGQILTLRVNGEVDEYNLCEVERHGQTRTFTLHRLATYSESAADYQCSIAANGQSCCNCKGGQMRGYCKHQQALVRLIETGKL